MTISIIDGPFMAFRAWSVGERRGMLDASVGTVLRQLKRCDRVSVVWEQPGRRGLDFRRAIDDGYKHRRQPKPEGFNEALTVLQGGLTWLGAHQAWPKDGEADDAGATLCWRALAAGDQVELWSADHDWLQLVVPGVTCYQPTKKRVVAPENIIELTGGDAAWHLNRMSLCGDTGDDVPGLPRIGKGRADKLLELCSEIVQLILGGRGSEVERVIASKAPNYLRWAQVAIDNVELLKNTRRLVELVEVPLLEVPGHPNAESALKWLGEHDLMRFSEEVSELLDPDPWTVEEKEPWE